MGKSVLNVIVTCTKQKRIVAPAELCVGSLKRGSVAERFNEWKLRITKTNTETHKASELYSGDHWATVLGFRSDRFEIKTWIASAGYGLLDLDDQIAPYSATFSKQNKDSIYNKLNKSEHLIASKLWWKHLTSWRKTSHSRSLKSLVRSRATEFFLVVASDKYLNAMEEDLADAEIELEDAKQLSILSAGCKSLGGLSKYLLPCDARFQYLVGGARRSVNTRVAAHLISTSRSLPTLQNLTVRLKDLMKDLPDLPVYDRSPVSNDDVAQYIVKELRGDLTQTHSGLLRKFRDSGKACEQSRFRELFKQVKMEIS